MNKKASIMKFIVFLVILVVIFMVGSRLMQNFLNPRNDIILPEDDATQMEILEIMNNNEDLFYLHTPEQTSTGGAVEYYYAIRNPYEATKKFFVKIHEVNGKMDPREITYHAGPIRIKPKEVEVNKFVVPAIQFSEEEYTFKVEIEYEASLGVFEPFFEPKTVILHTTK